VGIEIRALDASPLPSSPPPPLFFFPPAIYIPGAEEEAEANGELGAGENSGLGRGEKVACTTGDVATQDIRVNTTQA